MTKFKYIFALIIAMIVIASCQREDNFTVEQQQEINKVAGKWYLKAYLDDQLIFDSVNVVISESLGDSITIKDTINKFWSFKTKAALSDNKSEFQTELSVNENSPFEIGVKIANGKVINSDSIYLEIQFEDDVTPFGNTYQLKGHRAS